MILILLVIGIFAIVFGGAAAFKLKPSEVRLMKLRDDARQMGLHPMLVAMPEWVQPNSEKAKMQAGKGMIARYTLVFTGRDFSLLRSKVVDGRLFVMVGDRQAHQQPFLPYVLGLELYKEHVSVYWYDQDALPDTEVLPQLKQSMIEAVKKFSLSPNQEPQTIDIASKD